MNIFNKVLFVFFVLLASCSAKQAKQTGTADTLAPHSADTFLFRGLPWGVTEKDIIKKEGKPHKKDIAGVNTFLFYDNVIVSDYTSTLRFSLENGKMNTAVYYLNNNDFDKVKFMRIHLEEKLTTLYGDPDDSGEFEFSENEYVFFIDWKVKDTKISLTLSVNKEETEFNLRIGYYALVTNEDKNTL